MKNYDVDFEDVAFGDPSIDIINEALSEFHDFDTLEPVAPSVSDLVDLFIEYRKRVGRRNPL